MSQPTARCTRCNKLVYPSWPVAVRAILRGATTGGRGVKAYRCPTRGGGWHLTSHPITRRRAA